MTNFSLSANFDDNQQGSHRRTYPIPNTHSHFPLSGRFRFSVSVLKTNTGIPVSVSRFSAILLIALHTCTLDFSFDLTTQSHNLIPNFPHIFTFFPSFNQNFHTKMAGIAANRLAEERMCISS